MGARNLGECLALQLTALPASTPFGPKHWMWCATTESLASRDFTR